MLPLPSELTSLIVAFASLFSKPVWQHVQVLLVGALLAPGKREARAHLGMETQRQWSEKAIARTTPAVLALFSVVTLLAHQQQSQKKELFVRQAAWYIKRQQTFSDALAAVRQLLWREAGFHLSPSEADSVKVSRVLLERLTDAPCYAV
jgi:hypothetical protein